MIGTYKERGPWFPWSSEVRVAGSWSDDGRGQVAGASVVCVV